MRHNDDDDSSSDSSSSSDSRRHRQNGPYHVAQGAKQDPNRPAPWNGRKSNTAWIYHEPSNQQRRYQQRHSDDDDDDNNGNGNARQAQQSPYKQLADRIAPQGKYKQHAFTSRRGLPADAFQIPQQQTRTGGSSGNNGNTGAGSSSGKPPAAASGNVEGPLPYVGNGQTQTGGANNGNYVIPGFNAPTATSPTQKGSAHP